MRVSIKTLSRYRVDNRLTERLSVGTAAHIAGQVFAFTESGEWYYKEYPDLVNKAGSFLYEPAHSVHTLTVSADASEDAVVAFVVFGSNVNVDESGNVVSIVDAQTVYAGYQMLCEASGKNCDATIVLG